MPTPIDRAMQSRNLFLGFAGLVTAVAAYSIWGGDMFPAEAEPTGEPETWTDEEMRAWFKRRDLVAERGATREELLASVRKIRGNMRADKT